MTYLKNTTLQQHAIYKKIDKEYYYHSGQYQDANFINLIMNNHKTFFHDRDVETGFRKAFKGNWGAQEHTKKVGVVHDLNRLSYNAAISTTQIKSTIRCYKSCWSKIITWFSMGLY